MRILIMLSLIFTCANTKAQVNYVLNPDFEDYSLCPNTSDQISLANYWSAVDSNGNMYCTPEYCNTCAPIGVASVPEGLRGFQYPRSGNGYANVQIYFDQSDPFPYYRDYLLGRLSQTLQDGITYCVTFYVSFAESSEYFTDKVGAYLDDGSICNVNNCSGPLTQFQPQVENTTGLITDTLNWVKVEGTFTADGSERFITIGNFYGLNNSNATPAYNYSAGYSWLIVDDVSVVESNLSAFAGNDTWVVEGDSVFIGRTPEVGLECKWLVNGNVIDSGAGIWVHPTVTTTYVVEQTICGMVKTDTVTIEVWATSVNGITNGQQISIYPNPATNQLLVQQEKLLFTTALITNQLGQHIFSQPLSGKETKVDLSSLPAGVYSITLEGEKGREVRRFVKL